MNDDDVISRAELVDSTLMENITKAVRFIDHLKLSDANICRVMDVVLGFLCERGLIWLGSTPDYRFLPAESGGPLLSLTYRLDVSHEDAARLNGEMIDRLVAADLDSCGLIASLQGTTSKATQAVALA